MQPAHKSLFLLYFFLINHGIKYKFMQFAINKIKMIIHKKGRNFFTFEFFRCFKLVTIQHAKKLFKSLKQTFSQIIKDFSEKSYIFRK